MADTSTANANASNVAFVSNNAAVSGGGNVAQTNNVSQVSNATAQSTLQAVQQNTGATPQALQGATGAGTLAQPAPTGHPHFLNLFIVSHDLQVLNQAANLLHALENQIQPFAAVHETISISENGQTSTFSFANANNELVQLDHAITADLLF